MSDAPFFVGIAQIEIGERAGDGDGANIETNGKVRAVGLQGVEPAPDLGQLRGHVSVIE